MNFKDIDLKKYKITKCAGSSLNVRGETRIVYLYTLKKRDKHLEFCENYYRLPGGDMILFEEYNKLSEDKLNKLLWVRSGFLECSRCYKELKEKYKGIGPVEFGERVCIDCL